MPRGIKEVQGTSELPYGIIQVVLLVVTLVFVLLLAGILVPIATHVAV